MTRIAFAQLVGQKFYPPKIFGQWKENVGSKEYKWRDIGMKIVKFLWLGIAIIFSSFLFLLSGCWLRDALSGE